MFGRCATALVGIFAVAFGALFAPDARADNVTECTVHKFCYCVNTTMKEAIQKNVDSIRARIADQKQQGKAIGYMSIPLSTLAGGYFALNTKIAAGVKEAVDKRLGADFAWLMNPAAPENDLPRGATGADYMLMWTQVMEGKSGLGEDFDFYYFAGPNDFARHFGLDGTNDMKKLDDYFENLLKTDQGLQKLVTDNRIDKRSFRIYYALRASVAFSLGAHDEWNILRTINEARRSNKDFGIGRQLTAFFDGRAALPESLENKLADGYLGECKK
jgi:hypothetical protein